MDEGARIPVDQPRGRGYLRHNGEQVWSKQNGEILRQIATETNGAYIPAGTKRVNMADVYHGYIAQVPQTEFATAQINSYQARFQWFLAPALLLIVIEVWWSTRKPGTQASVTEQSEPPEPAAQQTSKNAHRKPSHRQDPETVGAA